MMLNIFSGGGALRVFIPLTRVFITLLQVLFWLCIAEYINGVCVVNVSVNDRKTGKEQLKSLVDLIAEML